jgi:BirA family transcriptional regulator, biotin operon repressor / biotin---[acetyl-CoA-carboxylase] ligase
MDQRPEWLHWIEQCSSTNSWAAEATALRHGDVVFTRQQTAGRGQHGRIWHSPPGVLTASFVLKEIPVVQLATLSLVTGVAVIHAVEEWVPGVKMKWPNDVFLQGRKLAGVLCESSIKSSDASARVVVGVGLNQCVEFNSPDDCARRISLHQVVTPPDELLLLERLRHHLLLSAERLRSLDFKTFLDELRKRDFLKGQVITVETAGEAVKGKAIGIGDRGELWLCLLDGTKQAFTSGHVVLF